MAKPVSFQSETLPSLDESDVETNNIPLSKSHSTQTRPSQQNESFGEAIHLSPKAAISLIVLWVASILFTAMITRYASSPNENSADMREITSVPKDETPSTITQKSRMDETIDVTRIVDGGTGTATATNRREQPVVQPEVPVDNARKIYTIRTVTIGDENTAKAFVTSLEEDGFRPARISRTTRGILITVGEFASVNEAQPMLEKLKNKTLNHRKPFRDAYVAKR